MKITWIGAAQSALDVATDPVGYIERKPLTALALAAGTGVLLGARRRAPTPITTALQVGVVYGLHQLVSSGDERSRDAISR